MNTADPEDTIAAISTPLGEGGIGIVRLSGPAAVSIARQVFVSSSGLDISILSVTKSLVKGVPG